MDCPDAQWLTNTEYLSDFRRRTYEERVPISGGINLTNRCNVKCVHCYIRDYKCGNSEKPELATDRIITILDEAAEAGCLFFLITGGEPLLHPDFHLIYKHARKLGMLASVFTNGTLLDESHVKLFKELPPHYLEITLYGATEKTFDLVTAADGSFKQCHRGIGLLKAAGIRFRLKAMMLAENHQELQQMQEFAADNDARFRFDPFVGPKLDGDLSPLKHRVTPREAVAAEMANEEIALSRLKFSKIERKPYREKYLYRCGTGTTSFFIDAFGGLQPCMMVTDNQVNLNKESFSEAWAKLASIRDEESPSDLPCRKCSDLAYCSYCPPVMGTENGLKVESDSFICQLGRYRRKALVEFEKNLPEGYDDERE